MYAVVVLSLLALAAAAPQKYETKYDGVDLKEIISNERLFDGYFKCILGKKQCTPDGEELKKNIPDALETNCSKCSDKQRAGAKMMIKYVYEKKPEQYKELERAFDPQGKYRKNYSTFIKS